MTTYSIFFRIFHLIIYYIFLLKIEYIKARIINIPSDELASEANKQAKLSYFSNYTLNPTQALKFIFQFKTIDRDTSSMLTYIDLNDKASSIDGIIKINKDEIVTFNLPRSKGQYGIGLFQIDSLYKLEKNSLVDQLGININYNISRLQSLSQKPLSNSWKSNDADAKCTYYSVDPEFTFNTYEDQKFEKLVSYQGNGFVLYKDKPGVHITTSFSNKAFTTINMVDFGIQGYSPKSDNKYSDIFISDQYYLNKTFLILIDDVQIDVYSLSITNDKISINYFAQIPKKLLMNTNEVTSFGMISDSFRINNSKEGDILVIGTSDIGIFFLKSSRAVAAGSYFQAQRLYIYGMISTYLNTVSEKTKFSLKSLDIVINKQTLYVSVKDYGLKIYNFNEIIKENTRIRTQPVLTPIDNVYKELDFEFYLPFIQKLDTFYNTMTDKIYIGISTKVGENNQGFFFELFIERNSDAVNELKPVLNKQYTSTLPIDYWNFVTDSHFTYIYNRITMHLIAIRRGLDNKIDEQSYVIPLDKFDLQRNDVASLSRLYIKGINNAISFNFNNKFGLIDNFDFKDEQLICRFTTVGNRSLHINLLTEACMTTSGTPVNNCRIYYSKIINVVDHVTPYVKTLLVTLFTLLFITLVIIIITCICYVKCCKEKCFGESITTHMVNIVKDAGIKIEIKETNNQNNKNELDTLGAKE